MKKNILLAIFILFAGGMLSAQERINPVFEFLKNEKFLTGNDSITVLPDASLMKRAIPIETDHEETIVSDDLVPESEITAAINPIDSNNIIVSAININMNNEKKTDCPVFFTKDFGKTWQKSTFSPKDLVEDEESLGTIGDPVIAFDKKGKTYFSWIESYFGQGGYSLGVYWASSNDGGETWNVADDRVAYSGSFLADKPWIAIDRSDGKNEGNVYISFTSIYIGDSDRNSDIMVISKGKDSEKFSDPVIITSAMNLQLTHFSQIETDSKGNLHLVFFGTNNIVNSLYYSRSTDGGNSFSDPVKITNFIFDGSNLIPGNRDNEGIPGIFSNRLYPCHQLAVDKSGRSTDGNIYLAWTADGIEKNEGNGKDIYFTASGDEGKNWTAPKIINDDVLSHPETNYHQYYPSIDVTQNGIVALAWYDRRGAEQSTRTDYYLCYSFDGGNSFTKNIPVTNLPTIFNTVGLRNDHFGIGEYNDMVSAGSYAIPFWADGRDNEGNLQIYCAKVPASNNPDIVAETISPVLSSIIDLNIQPNPANDFLDIRFLLKESGPSKACIFNINGRRLKKEIIIDGKPGLNTCRIDISLLPENAYFLQISHKNIYVIKKFNKVK